VVELITQAIAATPPPVPAPAGTPSPADAGSTSAEIQALREQVAALAARPTVVETPAALGLPEVTDADVERMMKLPPGSEARSKMLAEISERLPYTPVRKELYANGF